MKALMYDRKGTKKFELRELGIQPYAPCWAAMQAFTDKRTSESEIPARPRAADSVSTVVAMELSPL